MSQSRTRGETLAKSMTLVQEARQMAKFSKADALAKLAEARAMFLTVADKDPPHMKARTLSLFDQCKAAIEKHHA